MFPLVVENHTIEIQGALSLGNLRGHPTERLSTNIDVKLSCLVPELTGFGVRLSTHTNWYIFHSLSVASLSNTIPSMTWPWILQHTLTLYWIASTLFSKRDGSGDRVRQSSNQAGSGPMPSGLPMPLNMAHSGSTELVISTCLAPDRGGRAVQRAHLTA